MRVVIDTEWDGFQSLRRPWCIVCRDIDNPEDVYVFEHPYLDWRPFLEFSNRVNLWVGHNLIGFDLPALRSVCPNLRIEHSSCLDTLVVSHLLNHNIDNGHSLEAWALRLAGLPKKFVHRRENFVDNRPVSWYNYRIRCEGGCLGILKEFSIINNKQQYYLSILKKSLNSTSSLKVAIDDWSVYSQTMLERCVSDTLINLALFLHFERYLNQDAFKEAIKTEHEIAFLCRTLHENGFGLNVKGTRDLLTELRKRLSALDADLIAAFPPERVEVRRITARATASGAVHAVDFKRLLKEGFSPSEIIAGVEYPLYETVVFNPASGKQVIARLNAAGWKPIDKTKGHIEAEKTKNKDRLDYFREWGWMLSDANLATLPDTAPPAAKTLTERLMVSSRIKVLEAWLEQVKDGRIHARFNHIGAWTHRMSHAEPNMANVPKAKPKKNATALELFADKVNDQMRSFWCAPKGKRLIGVDADGIQMRIFAHYTQSEKLVHALIQGRKEDKTDIHSLHQTALGEPCKSRDDAKTFIYAWLLGAGVAKVAEILGCSVPAAKAAIAQFLEFYPALKELKKTIIPADAKRGYFVGLDKRLVMCYDAHLMLAGYLQNGEAIIMKRACVEWNKSLQALGIPYKFVNFVHDEWQVETEDDDGIANLVQQIMMDSIVAQGPALALNCPLAATGVQGYDWKATH